MSHYFMIWPILQSRAEIQKYYRSFFCSNENFKICFWDYPPTFTYWSSWRAFHNIFPCISSLLSIFTNICFYVFHNRLLNLNCFIFFDDLTSPEKKRFIKFRFSKGQIISEWLLDVFIWTKKRTTIFLNPKIGQIKKKIKYVFYYKIKI